MAQHQTSGVKRGTLALLTSLALAACGGGGERVGSTPPPPVATPAPPPPPPTNTVISNLVASQQFAGGSTTLDTDLALADARVGATSSSRGDITVDYNAATGSYTLTQGGRSAQFAAADRNPDRYPGEQNYRNAAGDRLTLVTDPYLAATPNLYVGLGYWQANRTAGGIQNTRLTAFTYGFDTPANDVPRSGQAHYQPDVVGFLAVPGRELLVVQGLGSFNVDFAVGSYRMISYLSEAAVVTDTGTVGALLLQSGGRLAAGGKFDGLLTYRSGVTDLMTGSMTGGFYGPGAAELGASFQATNSAGAHLTGALTGQRSNRTGGSDPIRNLTLTDIIAEERLFGAQTSLLWTAWNGRPGFVNLVEGQTVGSVDVAPGGVRNVSVTDGYNPVSGDLVAGPANFTTYQTSIRGNPARIGFYKPGAANTELALTYTSFVEWQTSSPTAIPDGTTGTNYEARYLVYGVKTPDNLLAARTGQASYRGVVHGTGANARGQLYDVGGTSRFSVDFSASTYSGQLTLSGTATDGAVRDLGQWSFASRLANGNLLQATMSGPTGKEFGSFIYPQFYGPTGEEIGATFTARYEGTAPDDRVHIVGVTVAKQD